MHEHYIEDSNGELVDVVKLCSDWCHLEWCERNDEPYAGWSGCHETEFTDWCANCGVVLPGVVEDENGPCDCQLDNSVARCASENGVKCEHGNWVQVPMSALMLVGGV